ncbi:MAG: ArsA family ATPase [Chloroflexi bacterium]|nr:ArsA family ATPase [Chloroflexota bacterium]
MAGQVPSFLADESLKLLLFGGKGGVGKTTAAAATALYRADQEPERKVLVVSTDPAHSLSDSFDQLIGDEVRPIAGVANLFALEMDAGRRLEDFKRQHGEVLKTIADRGTYFDQEDIANFFDLSLPGLDELMAVIEVADIVREGRYDLVILDTAPTGHTLRLLALPQLMEDWIRVLDLMMGKHRYMASVFTRRRYRPDETDAFLKHMSADLRRLRALLSDASATEFVPVTIPEAMSIEEMARLLEALESLRLRVRTVVVNRVISRRECPFCEARHGGQKRHLEEIERRFSAWDLVLVPLLPWEVRGQETLERYAQAMLGHEPSPSPLPSRRGVRMKEGFVPSAGSGWALAQRQLILFGGKGGVGKTTVAAATAIHLAGGDEGKKTLLFSTDPAHSLSDSLDQEIGNRITPVAGAEGLFALEMEAAEFVEELKQEYVAEINEVFAAFLGDTFDAPFDRQVMEELVSLTPPGLDELMALMKIMDFMEEGTFDRYILDLAPTGHALRFLEMPGLVRQWFTTFFKLLLKYQGVVRLTQVAALLRERSKQLRQVQRLLTDAERCQFIAVTIPEAMAVLETGRLLHRLAELSIACRSVVVNMVMPATECAFCATVRDEQQWHLEELGALAPGLIQAPLFPHEIRGIAGLTKMVKAIYGDGYG